MAGASSTAWRATLRVLPEVVAAVGGRTEVLLDGGIRRGSDVVKALCLGARAVLVGRAYAYGLGAGGGSRASRAPSRSCAPTSMRTLKLLGCPSVAELDESYVGVPAHWRRSEAGDVVGPLSPRVAGSSAP